MPYATISASNLPYSSRAIKIFRERYLDFLGANEGFYIDKMPINFEYLPWIIEGLPEAKIIMTERSLEKQIFAIFSRRFNTANYFCASLSDIYDYKVFYNTIKTKYLSEFSGTVCEFSLDRFQENQDKEIVKLLDFMNLERKDDYFTFYRSNKASNTMSVAQVRNKDYKPLYDVSQFWTLIKQELS